MAMDTCILSTAHNCLNPRLLPCSIHLDEMMTFTVDRQGEPVDIPIRPAKAPDGTGRIGVQLAANAQVSTQKAESPGQAVQLAGKQFAKLTKMVVSGEIAVCLLLFSLCTACIANAIALVALGRSQLLMLRCAPKRLRALARLCSWQANSLPSSPR